MESSPRLLDQMREALRLKHLSARTEEAYVSWASRLLFDDFARRTAHGRDKARVGLQRRKSRFQPWALLT